ncbi:MAG TPA: Ig-like domain repeat protein, partial [Acidobacteriaceae bacterium]
MRVLFQSKLNRLIVTKLLVCCGLLTAQTVSAQSVTQFPGTTTVGQSSASITVPITLTSTAPTYALSAVTQGVENLDFSITSETCTADEPAPPVGTICTATVVFTPKYPGLRTGAVLVKSSDGSTLLGSALLSGVGEGSLSVLDPGVINTIAGNQFWTYSPGNENYPANASSLYLPYGIVVDPSGRIFISDTLNGRVRIVDTSGKISTIAGDGTFGYSGDGGPATSAEVNEPSGLAIDGAGNIYFADSGNDVIRRIDAVTNVITTIAGMPGSAGFAGDGGAATAARLSGPQGVAFDAAGNLFIADTGNDIVRKVDATNGTISTVAGEPGEAAYTGEGTATANMLNMPWSVAIGPDGALYIADTGNSRIRRVIGGVISTVAGSNYQTFGGDGGPAIQAALNQPYGVALDPAGDLYVADSGNHCIRKVSPGSGVANGTALIQTIIGMPGSEGFSGDGKAANVAQVNGPYALYFAQNGDFYFADTHNDRIREVAATPFSMPQFLDTKATKVSADVQTENVDSDGNTDLNLSAPTLSNAELDAGTTTCSFTQPTPHGTTCVVGVEFAPWIAQQNLTGSVTLRSDAANTPVVIDIWGNGLDVNPTTVTVTSSASPSVLNQNVLLTATVTNMNQGALTGAVTFTDGVTTLCSNVNLSGESAACPASFSTVGQHTITASYSGDANNEAMSGTMQQTVKQQATIALALNPTETTVTNNVTLTATVTPSNGTGTITFYDGGTALPGATVALSGGTASFSTTQLAPGTHTLTAKYSGDASNAAGTSSAASVSIDQAATTTTLSTTNANPTVGDAVTLTAVVSGTDGFTPTGSVAFKDNGTLMPGSPATLNGSTATLTVNSLGPGNHEIVATYSGDTDDAVSYTSSGLLETVAQIATVTTLTSDGNPLSAGATLHLTATVALVQGANADGPLTGQVTFTDGDTSLGTVAIDGHGNATIAVSALQVGTHGIVAAYGGATNYTVSNSAALLEQIQKATTTVAMTSSAASVLAGEPLNLTVTIASSTGVPIGTVTFNDGLSALSTVPLSVQGTAILSISTLAVGSHTLTATYNGDANYSGITSSALSEIVALAEPTVTISGPANNVDVGTAVTVAGGMTGPGIKPTGTLMLRNGGNTIASQPVPPTGQFSFVTSSLPLGTNRLSVVYSGDEDNSSVTSPTTVVTVQLAATATALSASSNPGTAGEPVTFTASVVSDSPGVSGTIAFFDGATSLGTARLGANGTGVLSVPALGFGVHAITAVYNGDSQHASSTSAATSERIVASASATLTSSADPTVAGSDVALAAAIVASGGQTATGAVVFRSGTAVLGIVQLDGNGAAVLHTSSLSVGQDNITISYMGDSNVAAASTSLTETIVSATTQIALAASTVLSSYNTPLTLTATVTSNGGSPAGPVTFTADGVAIANAALNSQGIASLTVTTLSPGTHSVVASYAGDERERASISSPVSVIVKQSTAIVVESSVNPALTLSSIVLTARLTNEGAAVASGTIVFSDGSTQLGTAPLGANGNASITVPSLAAGVH